MPDDTHDIESYWQDVLPEITPSTGNKTAPALLPQPSFVGWHLEDRIQHAVYLVARGSGVRRAQTYLILLAIAFGIRPEDVPEGMLTEQRRLAMEWAASGPFYPKVSPPEALAVVRVATQIRGACDRTTRIQLARELEAVFAPWTVPPDSLVEYE